jgi:HSP20 family protein
MAQGKQESGQGQAKSGELQVRRGGRGQGMMRPFEDFDRLFESFFPRGWMRPFGMGMGYPSMEQVTRQMPAVDVIDHENDILVRAEVPGCTKDDIDISLSDSTMTIRGHSGEEHKEEDKDYYYHETSYGEFTRTVALPTDVDADKAQAKLNNGILEVTLPKVETSKRKQIKVEGG